MNTQPNIIFIVCDQLRADALGAYGNKVVETPNIDFLASQGTVFKNAYSAVPSCLPARATLWTGQNQWHTGVLGMGAGQAGIPNDFPHTMAGELTANGYETRLVGKTHFAPETDLMGFEKTELDTSGRIDENEDDYRIWFKKNAPASVTPDDHGVNWNSWHSRPWHTHEHLHPTAWTMKTALDILKIRTDTRPLFLNISFARPHSPYVPPKYYFDMYNNKELPQPACGDWAIIHDDPKTAKDINAWRGKMSSEQIHRARAGYYGEVSFIDTQIGRLINWMQKYNMEMYRNTYFILTSDHGDMLGDHNLWRKTYAYEGSVKIPLIITPPAKVENNEETIDEVVELRDIMPTVLNLANTDIPANVDGKSLQTLIAGDKKWRTYIHGEHCTCYSSEQEMQYVTNGKYKFIWMPKTNIKQFFDLQKDPSECKNLIKDESYSTEIAIWHSYLVMELENRGCGMTQNGKLIQQSTTNPLISPYKNRRWELTT